MIQISSRKVIKAKLIKMFNLNNKQLSSYNR